MLNRPESVREGLRLRVLEAVAMLGYVPHAGARALKLQRSGTVGAIFPTIDNAIFAQATNALQQRLADGGLQLLIATCGYQVDARDGFRALMANQSAPTAILCRNDVLAFGALLEANAMRIAVPQALSIVGFENLEIARHFQPALPTLHVPNARLWHAVADRIITWLEKKSPVRAATEFDVELVVRGSTGPAPRS